MLGMMFGRAQVELHAAHAVGCHPLARITIRIIASLSCGALGMMDMPVTIAHSVLSQCIDPFTLSEVRPMRQMGP